MTFLAPEAASVTRQPRFISSEPSPVKAITSRLGLRQRQAERDRWRLPHRRWDVMKVERMIGHPRPFAGGRHRRHDDLIGPQAADNFECRHERHSAHYIRPSAMSATPGFPAAWQDTKCSRRRGSSSGLLSST